MKFLIATDKFKGTLTAREVGEAVRAGLLRALPDADIILQPLADGGEGTCSLMTDYLGGMTVSAQVHGPLFATITAAYGWMPAPRHACIEMSQASGLALLAPHQRNPMCTTTLGTGELIQLALDRGAQKITLGIGGSATNDAGIGMAQALGYKFFDREGKALSPVGESLAYLHHIEPPSAPVWKNVSITALCDVDNPLYGSTGAAFVYAPQKGADAEMVKRLDEGLQNFEQVVQKSLGVPANFPGAGAGGGIGAGVHVFLGGTLQPGMDYVARLTKLEEKIATADVIITGEGKMDDQTLAGKVVGHVGALARRHQKKIIGVCGLDALTPAQQQQLGIDHILCLTTEAGERRAMEEGYEILVALTEKWGRSLL